jgi:Uma2 family endonuclease
LELVEGVLIEMTPAGGEHGGLASEALRLIANNVRERKLGYTTAAETGYILFKNPNGKDTVRAPDVGFVAAHRLPKGLPSSYIPCAPDLAVEVVSPNDSAAEIHDKVSDYLRYGTRMVWVFYPTSKSGVAYTPDGAQVVDSDGTLDGGDVLPGFTLALKDIFEPA